MSRQYESSPPGKENKSQSPKRKRSTSTTKSRPNTSSVLKGKALKQAFNTTIRKPSPIKTPSVQNSPEKKPKMIHHSKTKSGQNLDSSGTLHRRHNSSFVGQQSRLGSQERKSSHISRNNMNNSMLNNSSLIEDPMNYSREYSYLKDVDTSEFVHFGDIAVLYNSSNNSTLKMAGLNDQSSLGLNEENLSSPQMREDFIALASSKSLFKRV